MNRALASKGRVMAKATGMPIFSIATASTAVLAELGDLLHWDGFDAVTPASGHLLDADTRFGKLVRTAIRLLRQIIGILLANYKNVHIIIADDNHGPAGSTWMREMLHSFYENEPRITVDNSPDTYYCYEFGKTSLFFHHGHKRNIKNIDDVFANKFREEYGRTKYSFAHLGHLHHSRVEETNLMLLEQHRTLAAKDAYASRGGWLSGREGNIITYSKNTGYLGRVVITPEMINSIDDSMY